MFAASPSKMAALIGATIMSGQNWKSPDRNCYGNGRDGWIRTWRTRRATFGRRTSRRCLERDGVPLCSDSFLQDETEAKGLVFEHYAYVTEQQVAFKEAYYGYANALKHWRQLQQATPPVQLEHDLPWVRHPARSDAGRRADSPVMIQNARQWSLPGVAVPAFRRPGRWLDA